MAFEVTLTDDTTERVEGADSYTLEGPLTTFFGWAFHSRWLREAQICRV